MDFPIIAATAGPPSPPKPVMPTPATALIEPSRAQRLRMKPLQSAKKRLPVESSAMLVGLYRAGPAEAPPTIVEIVYSWPNIGVQARTKTAFRQITSGW